MHSPSANPLYFFRLLTLQDKKYWRIMLPYNPFFMLVIAFGNLGTVTSMLWLIYSRWRGLHCSLNKVRAAAKHLGLPNWRHAASPCLRSRLALGVLATDDALLRVHKTRIHKQAFRSSCC